MAKTHYNRELATFTPYGSQINNGSPGAGDTGEPWGAQYSSYGMPGALGAGAQNAIARVIGIARALAPRYDGLPDNRAVYYNVASPMQYLRSTGPEPAQVSDYYSGPVAPMAFEV